MFGLVPKTMWSKWTEADADNRIALATRSLLVESRDGLVLIEAGYGDKWSTRERELYELEQRTAVDALAEHGIDPRDIGHVMLTHLHFDHAAGLTRDGGAGAVSVFTNARIHVQRQEWLDALANKSTMTKTYFWSHLDPVATQMELHDGACAPLDRISLIPTPGHTWGHQSVLVAAADKCLPVPDSPVPDSVVSDLVLFPGDACPTMHHAHPAASLGCDMLAYDAMMSKREILGRAAREGWKVALDHDPSHALFRATLVDTRVLLEPIPLAGIDAARV
jgi:glyoxylase-like metal-dependent hydrolase (beta-lactamase superfamily II)